MKYAIGTRIEFFDDSGYAYEYYDIEAYAILKDGSTVYLVWSSYAEYCNEYEFFSEEQLAQEIKERIECGNRVEIKEAV